MVKNWQCIKINRKYFSCRVDSNKYAGYNTSQCSTHQLREQNGREGQFNKGKDVCDWEKKTPLVCGMCNNNTKKEKGVWSRRGCCRMQLSSFHFLFGFLFVLSFLISVSYLIFHFGLIFLCSRTFLFIVALFIMLLAQLNHGDSSIVLISKAHGCPRSTRILLLSPQLRLHNRTNVSVLQFSIGNGSDYFARPSRNQRSMT